jgi:hypothetical protein
MHSDTTGANRRADVTLMWILSTTTQQLAADPVRLGEQAVLVSIPDHDSFLVRASVVCSMGVTIPHGYSYSAAHVYGRAITLVRRSCTELPLLLTRCLPPGDAARRLCGTLP